jgi:hypothetical protein
MSNKPNCAGVGQVFCGTGDSDGVGLPGTGQGTGHWEANLVGQVNYHDQHAYGGKLQSSMSTWASRHGGRSRSPAAGDRAPDDAAGDGAAAVGAGALAPTHPRAQQLPDSTVKAVLASFMKYFGTDLGTRLRAWCIAHGWVLMWSVCERVNPHNLVKCLQSANFTQVQNNDLSNSDSSGNASQTQIGPLRLLDLTVLVNTTAGANLNLNLTSGVACVGDNSNSSNTSMSITQQCAWELASQGMYWC